LEILSAIRVAVGWDCWDTDCSSFDDDQQQRVVKDNTGGAGWKAESKISLFVEQEAFAKYMAKLAIL
jgi:hypothetical protein